METYAHDDNAGEERFEGYTHFGLDRSLKWDKIEVIEL